jgi:hypothetical protein
METPTFRARVLDMFAHELKLAGWADADVPAPLLPLQPERVTLKRVSGAFSNVVIFASYSLDGVAAGAEALVGPPTVLLRVYGTATEVLLSRRAELLILHTLSSLYEIGVSAVRVLLVASLTPRAAAHSRHLCQRTRRG